VTGEGRWGSTCSARPSGPRRQDGQICEALGIAPERTGRLTLAGVGGAFGGREDLSMHVHACLLARHTGKPVKMVYSREESCLGSSPGHPGDHLHYEHWPSTPTGAGLREVRSVFDGRATRRENRPRSSATADDGNGPPTSDERRDGLTTASTQQPAVRGDAAGSARCRRRASASTDGPLRVGARLDPVEFRGKESKYEGSRVPTGPDHRQARRPLGGNAARSRQPLPTRGGTGPGPAICRRVYKQHHGEGVRRGGRRKDVGYYKTVGFLRGFDDTRPRGSAGDLPRRPLVHVHTASAGRPGWPVEAQIARHESAERGHSPAKDTNVGTAVVRRVPADLRHGGSGQGRRASGSPGPGTGAGRTRSGRPPAAGGPAPDRRHGGRPDTGEHMTPWTIDGRPVLDEEVEWRHAHVPVDRENGQGFAQRPVRVRRHAR